MQHTDNLRIKTLKALIAPALLIEQHPLDESISNTIIAARAAAANIIHGKDDRLLVIVGPCSIHDPEAAIEYAKRLKTQVDKHHKDLHIIMRVYFEKPRTRTGWKGLINDPNLDDSFNINQGLTVARKLLLSLNKLGVPTGSEYLDTTIPQYISDLTSWSAIGARTTESQIHRELASGLSMPVGFKNSTTGNIQVAADAVCAASQPHHFLGVSKQGVAAIVSTTGNQDCHIILRGSSDGPNYDEPSIQAAIKILEAAELTPRLMVDMSHGNSSKDFRRQKEVVKDMAEQLSAGSDAILGVMIESNLQEGNQALTDKKSLIYGKSITDACIGWEETEDLLDQLSVAIKNRRKHHV